MSNTLLEPSSQKNGPWRQWCSSALLRASAREDVVEQHQEFRKSLGINTEIPWRAGSEPGELGSLVSSLGDFRALAKLATRAYRVVFDIGGSDGVSALAIMNFLQAEKATVIEKNPELVELGRQMAQKNKLPISFQNCDARVADYSHGNFFYLYCPFGESTTKAVIDRITWQTQEAQEITLCTRALPEERITKNSCFIPDTSLDLKCGLKLWKKIA